VPELSLDEAHASMRDILVDFLDEPFIGRGELALSMGWLVGAQKQP
jgi:hypothetical protein